MMFSIATLFILALSPVVSLGIAYAVFVTFEAGLGIKPLPSPMLVK